MRLWIAFLLLLLLVLPVAAVAGPQEEIVFIPGPTESDLMDEGENGSYVFNRTGVYRYDCRPHQSLDMTGDLYVIRAEDANNTTYVGSLQINMTDNFVYEPSNVTVTVGTNITWFNKEASRHNILVYRTANIYEPTEDPTGEEEEKAEATPGFQLAVLLLAVLTTILLAAPRRR